MYTRVSYSTCLALLQKCQHDCNHCFVYTAITPALLVLKPLHLEAAYYEVKSQLFGGCFIIYDVLLLSTVVLYY